jgi:hypothetical protein
MLIKCAFVGHKKTLIFIEMHGTTTTKIIPAMFYNVKTFAATGHINI